MTQVGPMLAGPRWAPCQVGPMNIAIWVLKEVMWSKIIFQQNHCSLWQVDHALNDILEVWHRQLCIFTLTHAIFSPNLHWWTNDACSCLLRTRTFCIIGIYKFMHQQLSLHYIMHIQHDCPSQMISNLIWHGCHYQINSQKLVNLLLRSIKFSSICEGQPCRVGI